MLGTAPFWRNTAHNFVKRSNPMRHAVLFFFRWRDNGWLRDTNSSKTRLTKIVLSSPLPGKEGSNYVLTIRYVCV